MEAVSDGKSKMIECLLRMCNKVTLHFENHMDQACKGCLVICLRFIDKRQLFEMVLGDLYVDWDVVYAAVLPVQQNFLGGSGIWMNFMDLFNFGSVNIPEKEMQKNHPALYALYMCVKGCGFYSFKTHQHALVTSTTATTEVFENAMKQRQSASSMMLSFDDVCKLYILMNVENMQSSHAVQTYTGCRLPVGAAKSLFTNILSSVADVRQSSQGYVSTFSVLLKEAKVDVEMLSNLVRHHKHVASGRMMTRQLKCAQEKLHRPSMREVIRASGSGGRGGGGSVVSSSDLSTIQDGTNHTTLDSYCESVRFPISMSKLLKMRCYLLAAQTVFDYRVHAGTLLSPDIASMLGSYPVLNPKVDDLCACIESLTLNEKPFDELNKFRDTCFVSFPHAYKKNLTQTQVLHLYLAAYQRKDLWKSCWKKIFPVMSQQISKDVEDFVSTTPIAATAIVRIMKTSNPYRG